MQRVKFALSMLGAVLMSLAMPNFAARASTDYAESDGIRIAFEVVGEGEPLVLIPGFSQSRQAWKAAGFVDAFVSRGRQVILIDPRGHGESDKPTHPSAYELDALARDIVSVLDRLGVEQADLLGYSRGGAIAIATAATHADRVRLLVAGGAHPFAEDMSPFRQAVAPGLENWIAVIEANVGPLPPDARAMFLANDVDALLAAVAVDRPDQSAALAESGVPTLLYAGSNDPRAEQARRFAETAGATFLELPGLNHFQAFFAVEPIVRQIERLRGRHGAPPRSS